MIIWNEKLQEIRRREKSNKRERTRRERENKERERENKRGKRIPGNQSLVETRQTAAGISLANGHGKRVTSVCGHVGLCNLERLACSVNRDKRWRNEWRMTFRRRLFDGFIRVTRREQDAM